MIGGTFRWRIDPVESLGRLAAGVRNKALRIALNAAAAPVKAAVIASAPKASGHLAYATIIKVINYRAGNTWVAVVGAGSKFKRLLKRKGRTVKKGGKRQYVRPALYQQFVDRGTSHIRGRHYLTAAFARSKARFDAIARVKLKQVLEELMHAK